MICVFILQLCSDVTVYTQIVGFSAFSELDYHKMCPLIVSNRADIGVKKFIRKLISDPKQPGGYLERSGRSRPLGQFVLARQERPADPPAAPSAA